MKGYVYYMKKLLVVFSVLLLCANVLVAEEKKSTKQKELEKKIELLEKETNVTQIQKEKDANLICLLFLRQKRNQEQFLL